MIPIHFRVWTSTTQGAPGEVIALLVSEPADDPRRCRSYCRIGGWASADPQAMMRLPRPATAAEYGPLKAELEAKGWGPIRVRR